MARNCGIIPAIFIALCFTIANTETNVPVYIWNIDSDVVFNAIPSLSSQDLVLKLSPSLDRSPIALFLQNELSTEDFKSGDLENIRALSQEENDGVVFAPSVTNTKNLPDAFKSAGFQIVRIKSSQALPATIADNTVLVVDLPATEIGSSRSLTLEQNAAAINKIYEDLKLKNRGVIGILSASKNSRLMADQSRRRITRNTRAESTYSNDFVNATTAFIYFETAPVLKVYSDSDPKEPKWYNFTLAESPTVVSTMSNSSSAKTVEGDTNTISLTYTGVDYNGTALTSATINMILVSAKGYWSLTNVTVSAAIQPNGGGGPITFTDAVLTPQPITTPMGSSYHCSPNYLLASFGYKSNATVTGIPPKIALEMNGFQLQPFKITKDKFGDWYDCQGFFTEGIWAAILIGLVLAMMLAWAVSMVDDIKGPDRFDDPKGKSITVPTTE